MNLFIHYRMSILFKAKYLRKKTIILAFIYRLLSFPIIPKIGFVKTSKRYLLSHNLWETEYRLFGFIRWYKYSLFQQKARWRLFPLQERKYFITPNQEFIREQNKLVQQAFKELFNNHSNKPSWYSPMLIK